jgi:hypothetical protein
MMVVFDAQCASNRNRKNFDAALSLAQCARDGNKQCASNGNRKRETQG